MACRARLCELVGIPRGLPSEEGLAEAHHAGRVLDLLAVGVEVDLRHYTLVRLVEGELLSIRVVGLSFFVPHLVQVLDARIVLRKVCNLALLFSKHQFRWILLVHLGHLLDGDFY